MSVREMLIQSAFWQRESISRSKGAEAAKSEPATRGKREERWEWLFFKRPQWLHLPPSRVPASIRRPQHRPYLPADVDIDDV